MTDTLREHGIPPFGTQWEDFVGLSEEEVIMAMQECADTLLERAIKKILEGKL